MLSKARPVATLDVSNFYVEQSLVCIVPHGVVTEIKPKATLPLKFILGVINSRLEQFYFESYVIDQSLGGGLIHATPGTHDKLIIPKPQANQIEQMVKFVEKMLSLTPKLHATTSESEKAALQNSVKVTEKEIDSLVYELYGLTEEEIRIVEGVG
jgi:hypothetical protein